MTPDLALFVCDERFTDIDTVKPGRIQALSKADYIIFNVRATPGADPRVAEALCKSLNAGAVFLPIDIRDQSQVHPLIQDLLSRKGFI